MGKVEELVRLVDAAIASADALVKKTTRTNEAWMAEDATTAIRQFQRIKVEVLSGLLPPSRGAGLGITRALSEWAPDDLYAAGKAVEDFYRNNFN